MILHLSLGGFFCMLLRMQRVRGRQVGVMADLLVVAALVKFGCLLAVASRLFIVLCCCAVVFCSGGGNRKIRGLACPDPTMESFAPLGITFHSCVWTDLAGRPLP
jgi:hypothetical protein